MSNGRYKHTDVSCPQCGRAVRKVNPKTVMSIAHGEKFEHDCGFRGPWVWENPDFPRGQIVHPATQTTLAQT